jgi:integrase
MTEPKKLPPGIRERHGAYQVRYYGPDGRERCKSFAKITEAKKFRAAVMTDKARGRWHDPKTAKALFSDVAEAHLSRKIKLRPRTAEKYRSSLRCYLNPAFGRTPLGAITSDEVQDWVSGMVRGGLAPETVRGHYGLMAAIMKRAAVVGRISESPCRGIDLPAVERVEQRFLDESEVDRLAAATPERYRALVYVGAYLGLRWQEVAGLRREAITMRPNRLATVRVVTTIERSNGRCRAVEYGKGCCAKDPQDAGVPAGDAGLAPRGLSLR